MMPAPLRRAISLNDFSSNDSWPVVKRCIFFHGSWESRWLDPLRNLGFVKDIKISSSHHDLRSRQDLGAEKFQILLLILSKKGM